MLFRTARLGLHEKRYFMFLNDQLKRIHVVKMFKLYPLYWLYCLKWFHLKSGSVICKGSCTLTRACKARQLYIVNDCSLSKQKINKVAKMCIIEYAIVCMCSVCMCSVCMCGVCMCGVWVLGYCSMQ